MGIPDFVRESFLPHIVDSVSRLFLFFLAFAELRSAQSNTASVYLYPLANNTGTAEVIYGGGSGYDGLGYVTSFSSHPSLPYGSLYFEREPYSHAELKIGTPFIIQNDWTFTMFVYSRAPHRGTIFDFMYDGTGSDPLWSDRIKLELNDTEIVFTHIGSSGDDHGSAVIGTIFNTEAWIPLSVVHDESTGNTIIQTVGNEFYKSSDFQNNRNNVKLSQPAKIKLGGSYDAASLPFEGSIVCFAVYDTQIDVNGFDETLNECDPNQWPNTPSFIDISTLTTPQPTTTTATLPLPPSCPGSYGYFDTVGVDSRPNGQATFTTTNCISSRKCGHMCLLMSDCFSFTYNKITTICSIFDQIYTNLSVDTGTRYYKRRNLC